MAADDVANAHYRAQAALAAQAATAGQELWARIDPGAVLESWRPLAEQAAAVLTAAQYAAAAQAQPYLVSLAEAMGAQPAPVAPVDPAAFAGAAADGGDLVSLLMVPALRTLGLMAVGADDQDALRSGLAALVRMMATETADAGRLADGVAMTADRSFVSYTRVVRLPACARCIILAGREYSWSTGFARHPQCDCQMVPRVYRPGRGYDTPEPANPDELFARLSVDEQDRLFGRANAEAIREGADIGQVVNARRGMTTAGGKQVTTEGTTSRGHAGRLLGQLAKEQGSRYRRSQIPRLTPAQIYAEAGGNRDEAIRLLTRFGYLDRWSVASRQRAVSGLERQAAAERAARQAKEARQEAIERARQAIAEARRRAENARQEAARAAAERARRQAEEAAQREAEEQAQRAAERARREAEVRARRETVPQAARPYHRNLNGIEDVAAAVARVDDQAEHRPLSGGQSAATELVILADGSRLVRKRGMDWGDPDEVAESIRGQADAEQLASLVGRAIGAPVVRVYRDADDSVWMNWADGKVIGDVSDRSSLVASRGGALLGLLDHLIANSDRNSGNIIVGDDGQLVGIDHGWSWGEHNLGETGPVVQDDPDRPASHFSADGQWKDNPLTAADVVEVRRRLEGLREDFARIGREAWLDHSMMVLDQIGRHATGTVNLLG